MSLLTFSLKKEKRFKPLIKEFEALFSWFILILSKSIDPSISTFSFIMLHTAFKLISIKPLPEQYI